MKITEISSNSNALFKRWYDLSNSKGIRQHQEFVLSGEKLVKEFLKKPGLKIKAEIIHEDLAPLTNSSIFKLSKKLFNELDVIGTHFNLLVLELPEVFAQEKFQPQGLELVCPLGDPGNLGAMIRSAKAFGVEKIILTEESAHPFHPKTVKASAGAVLNMNFAKTVSVEKFCEKAAVVALDMTGTSITKYQWPKDLFLLVGEEGPGIEGLNIQQRIMIQTSGVESLNAMVAMSIALYERARYKMN